MSQAGNTLPCPIRSRLHIRRRAFVALERALHDHKPQLIRGVVPRPTPKPRRLVRVGLRGKPGPEPLLQQRVLEHLAATRKRGDVVNCVEVARELGLAVGAIYYVAKVAKLNDRWPYQAQRGHPRAARPEPTP